jgi:hypothetical protein
VPHEPRSADALICNVWQVITAIMSMKHSLSDQMLSRIAADMYMCTLQDDYQQWPPAGAPYDDDAAAILRCYSSASSRLARVIHEVACKVQCMRQTKEGFAVKRSPCAACADVLVASFDFLHAT